MPGITSKYAIVSILCTIMQTPYAFLGPTRRIYKNNNYCRNHSDQRNGYVTVTTIGMQKETIANQHGISDDTSIRVPLHVQEQEFMSRRSLLKSFKAVPAIVTVTTCTSLAQMADPEACNAATGSGSGSKVKAKGAAEYDLEFYVRNLIQGNNDREGNIQASAPPPSLPSRSLVNANANANANANVNSSTNANANADAFIKSIINDELDANCIAIRTLSQVTSLPAADISQQIIAFRGKVEKTFATRLQWQKESVVDEYYFDLTAYSLYRIAAVLITDYKLRSQWVNLLGDEIYKNLVATNAIAVPAKSVSKSNEQQPVQVTKLTETIPIMQQILQTLQSNNFIDTYRLGDKNDDYRSGSNIFDKYDDDDIDSGLSINCLVSLLRPATLNSSLQIVGEGSRFIPEFVGTTLAAMWRQELGLRVEYETYFVDEEYRPNPKDYFPSEQLLQYTLKK